jgi:hypothetical protein
VRRLQLMSFKGIGKSIRMMRAPAYTADALAHHSDEFPSWLFLDELLSSRARRRFTSRSRI